MRFNQHYELEGRHAFLGASNYYWLNYDQAKLEMAFKNHLAKERGTKLHAFAAECISMNEKLARSKKTLNMYVNDAIGFRMRPEQGLFYSDNAFGTTDAICFRKNLLRINDLKTGLTPAKMDQLLIYAALFCLEYGIKPSSIDTELRLYQNNDIIIDNPTAGDISETMDKIVEGDRIIENLKEQVIE